MGDCSVDQLETEGGMEGRLCSVDQLDTEGGVGGSLCSVDQLDTEGGVDGRLCSVDQLDTEVGLEGRLCSVDQLDTGGGVGGRLCSAVYGRSGAGTADRASVRDRPLPGSRSVNMSCRAAGPPLPPAMCPSDGALGPTAAHRADMLPTEGLVQSAAAAEPAQGFIEYYISSVKVSHSRNAGSRSEPAVLGR